MLACAQSLRVGSGKARAAARQLLQALLRAVSHSGAHQGLNTPLPASLSTECIIQKSILCTLLQLQLQDQSALGCSGLAVCIATRSALPQHQSFDALLTVYTGNAMLQYLLYKRCTIPQAVDMGCQMSRMSPAG